MSNKENSVRSSVGRVMTLSQTERNMTSRKWRHFEHGDMRLMAQVEPKDILERNYNVSRCINVTHLSHKLAEFVCDALNNELPINLEQTLQASRAKECSTT